MQSLLEVDYSPSVHSFNIIKDIVDLSFARKSLQRSFGRSFHGFAAYLSVAEMQNMKRFAATSSTALENNLLMQSLVTLDGQGLLHSSS